MKWQVHLDGVPLGKMMLEAFGVGDTLLVEGVSCRVISYTQDPREVWLKKL